MARRKDKAVDRRTFLRSAAVGAAAAAVSPAFARAAREPTRGGGPRPCRKTRKWTRQRSLTC